MQHDRQGLGRPTRSPYARSRAHRIATAAARVFRGAFGGFRNAESRGSDHFALQGLEGRRLLSGTPYGGTAPNVGAGTTTLEAENFDVGGEGVAYHDADSTNNGGQYRTSEGVDILTGGTNGYDVGYTAPGEWLTYTINVTTAGNYSIAANASGYGTGTFHYQVDGTNIGGTQNVPNNNSWTAFSTTSTTSGAVSLSAGTHVIKVLMDGYGTYGNVGNFDSFTVSSVSGTPYGGTAPSVGAGTTTLQAENYDVGGEGIAYHDADAANNGGQYRSDGVDILTGGGNGYNVGYTAPGEWLTYTINVTTAGNYTIAANASGYGTGTFHYQVDGANAGGTQNVPNNGSWSNFTTTTTNSGLVSLSAGTHVLKVLMDTNGTYANVGNFDSFTITAASTDGTPYGGTAPTVGAGTTTIQAENFNAGGEGAAYHDTTSTNDGGQYRTSEGVDIVTGGSNGYNVGYTATGEWLKYTINVTAAGNYTLAALASGYGTGTFHYEIDGTSVGGTQAVPNNSSWTNFTTTSTTSGSVYLSAGTHVIKVVMDGYGTYSNVGNFDAFTITAASTDGTPYGGTAPSVGPGSTTLQAENYNAGGEGAAYHDTTSTNDGGAYRTSEGVDVVTGGSNGYNVGYTATGEWLKYTINVTTAGNYTITANASGYGTGTFHYEVDGVSVGGTQNVLNNSSWTAFSTTATSSGQIYLSAGTHVIKVVMDGYGTYSNVGNFDYFTVTSASGTPAPTGVSVAVTGASMSSYPATLASGDTVNWNWGGSDPSVSYQVYRSTTPGSIGSLVTTVTNGSKSAYIPYGWVDSSHPATPSAPYVVDPNNSVAIGNGVWDPTIYYYTVKAVSGGVTSAASAQVCPPQTYFFSGWKDPSGLQYAGQFETQGIEVHYFPYYVEHPSDITSAYSAYAYYAPTVPSNLPVVFGGVSFGGWAANQAAANLGSRQVSYLALFDPVDVSATYVPVTVPSNVLKADDWYDDHNAHVGSSEDPYYTAPISNTSSSYVNHVDYWKPSWASNNHGVQVFDPTATAVYTAVIDGLNWADSVS